MSKTNKTWDNIVSGDSGALEELYYDMFDRLLNYGMRIINDRDKVEDAIQEIFLMIWSKKEHIKIYSSISNYLFTCLRREIIHQLDRHKHESISSFELFPYPTNISDEESKSTRLSMIQSEITNLPTRQKEIVYLKYKENMNYDEIEQIMGINRNSSYKLLHKAINKLKLALLGSAD